MGILTSPLPRYYEELLSAGVLAPLKQKINNCHAQEEGTQHFVAQDGVSSIVKYFFSKSGSQTVFQQQVSHMDKSDSNKWYMLYLITHKVI